MTTAQFDRLMDGFETTSGDPAFALHVGEMFNLLDLAILTTLVNTSPIATRRAISRGKARSARTWTARTFRHSV